MHRAGEAISVAAFTDFEQLPAVLAAKTARWIGCIITPIVKSTKSGGLLHAGSWLGERPGLRMAMLTPIAIRTPAG